MTSVAEHQEKDDPQNPVGHDLTKHVRRAAMWSAASVLVLKIANIGVTAAAARLLAPEDFGVFAVASAVYTVVTTMAEMGLSAALTRADLEISKYAPTVLTITVGAGLGIAAVLAVLAGPIALAFRTPEAADPIRILAMAQAVWVPFAVPFAQLTRDFQQKKVFWANAIAFFPANMLMLLLAAHGSGAMAFAWSRVFGMSVIGLIVWASVDTHYRLGFDRDCVRPLLAFGVPLAAASLIGQLNLNVDYLLIGRRLTPTHVGLYLLAFNVSSWTPALVTAAIQGVAVPAVSRVSHDIDLLHEAIRSATRLVALLAFPLAGVCLALATPIIRVLYGHRYEEAAPALVILCGYGALLAMSVLFSQILVGMGRTAALLGGQAAVLLVLGPALALGIAWVGIVGAAAAHAAVIVLVTIPICLRALVRATGVRLAVLWRAVWPPIVASVATAAVVWVVTRPFDRPAAQLAIGGCVAPLVLAVVAGQMILPYTDSKLRGSPPVGGSTNPSVALAGRGDGRRRRMVERRDKSDTPDQSGGAEPHASGLNMTTRLHLGLK